jgi:sugar phosphate isomerase/epimerase
VAEVPFSFCRRLDVALPTLRSLGCDGVELLLGRAEDVDPTDLDRLLAKHEMELSAIGTGLATTDGLYLGSREERTRQEAVKRVLEISKIAERFDCGVIVGSIKGGVVPAPSLECLYKSMMELREVRLIIEPLNRYESAIVNKASQAVELIRSQNLERALVLLDTFHMNIEEKSMADAIMSVGERLGYFHIADSNRRAPGDGHIPFSEVFRALKEIYYDGYVSAEILQEPNSEVALRKTVEFVRAVS